jgi:hypothetical protein
LEIKGGIIVSMRVLIALGSLASALLAQGQAGLRLRLDLNSTIGLDTAAQIQLVPMGSWKGLMAGAISGTVTPNASIRHAPSRPHRMAEATVEVWDFALPEESLRHETFRLFKEDLLLSIKRNWSFAPPSHGRIDLAIRGGDGKGGGTDMAMVQSLQQRFIPSCVQSRSISQG